MADTEGTEMMTWASREDALELVRLREANAMLQAEVTRLEAYVESLEFQIEDLHAEVADLRGYEDAYFDSVLDDALDYTGGGR